MDKVSDFDDEYLLLSGIQHFAFCPRQWALIHIEGVWTENYLTAQGRQLHDKADDPWFKELRKDKVISRAMPIRSRKLKMQGIADVVELISSDEGVMVPGQQGCWKLHPIEYKRGRPKNENCDMVQLCAQAICLEEMLDTHIPRGAIFYGQTRRRMEVIFSDALRKEVFALANAMHMTFSKNETPIAKKGKQCRTCSLMNDCHPELTLLKNKVDLYIKNAIEE